MAFPHQGRARPEEPILRAFKNIQVKKAVLTWDGEPVPKIVDGKETYPKSDDGPNGRRRKSSSETRPL